MISEKDLTDLCFDINECSDEPCKDLEYCMNMIGSYECQCLEGYKYNEVEQCEDINECEEDLLACGSNNICKNNPGSYDCSCKPGFESLGFDCGDIDECLSAPCDEFAFCTNLPGSYKCECKSGYFGDGVQCNDVNECDDNPCQNAECINNNGSFICSCYTGCYKSFDGPNCHYNQAEFREQKQA